MTDPKPAAKDKDADISSVEYLEFVGTPPYGTEFTAEHHIPKQHMKDVHDIKSTKDLVWRKGPNGRMLVPTKDIDPEVLAYLETDPLFKKVTL